MLGFFDGFDEVVVLVVGGLSIVVEFILGREWLLVIEI